MLSYSIIIEYTLNYFNSFIFLEVYFMAQDILSLVDCSMRA